jgi:hypothetical protein
MKNKLKDLHNHLFMQLERLSDEDVIDDDEKFNKEVRRADAICKVSGQIIANGNLVVNAFRAMDNANDPEPKKVMEYLE